MERIFELLGEAVKAGRDVALVTVVATKGSTPRGAGAKMLVFEDGSIEGTVGGGKLEALCIRNAQEALAAGEHRKVDFELTESGIGMHCEGSAEVFIEVYGGSLRLILLGAGHVSQKVAEVAAAVGLEYEVADDRAEFANLERFPAAKAIHVAPAHEALATLKLNRRSQVIIVTRGHQLDEECLEAAMKTEAGYIGMIGSRSKVPQTFKGLNDRGLSPQTDPRVFAPIGLDLGGKTPGEIALSILSEILKLHYQRTAAHHRLTQL